MYCIEALIKKSSGPVASVLKSLEPFAGISNIVKLPGPVSIVS